MLKETVRSIIEAEQKAEKIIEDALTQAKQMSLNATNEAEKIKQDTKDKVKAERQKVVESASKDAEDRYNEIISLGVRKSKQLSQEIETNKAVELIKNKVLNKYGRR